MPLEINDEMRAAVTGLASAKPSGQSHRPRQFLVQGKKRGSAGLWCRSFASDALGVNPDQIPEAREELLKHGIAVDFDAEGRCIVTGNEQYKNICRTFGMYNGRDGYMARDKDGLLIETGRNREKEKARFTKRVMNGEFD